MLTATAKNDLAALRQQGFNPTDEEIIKLNDLAIRIEQGKETTPANMPRIGFAGNVVLHEPTIGAIQWWNDFGSDAAFTSKGRLMTYFFMLANARRIDYLNQFQRPKDIRREVKKWKSKLDSTEQELWRAMMWVKFGSNEVEEEITNKINDSTENEQTMNDLWQNLITAAGSIGVTPDMLKTQTQSELVATLIQANIHARIPMKMSVAKDYIAYRLLLRNIEDRCMKETENG